MRVKKVSHVYETRAVGIREQPDFLNAAIEVETLLDVSELLQVCLRVEKEMGRTRTERWGPRNIDIDILLYGNVVLKKKDLTVPHPLLHTRGFVLYPLSDIAPEVVHPVLGSTMNELKTRVGQEGIRRIDELKLDV